MPLRVDYHAIHEVARMAGERAMERFNTPNWENARNFLIATTGYDPISDWTWPRRGMGVQDVKERLNQILRVRHSFAHGFAIPSYSWTTSKRGASPADCGSATRWGSVFQQPGPKDR